MSYNNTIERYRVDFSKKIRDWDGFGVNYVEAAQTRDYGADPQEYGAFSLLSESQRQEILDMIFGEDGLKPGLIKMLLDCFHQEEPGPDYNWDPNVIDLEAYDHTTTTEWMRYFARGGSETFSACRTSEDDRYVSVGNVALRNGAVSFNAPARSATTFYGA
jgi:hypothetical protein